MGESSDLQGAASNGRSRERHRVAGAHFAGSHNLQIKVATLHLANRNLAVAGT
jgi:hypothetical protein